ncbi:exodeoxyribonuclease [Nasonia vitripennis]|uniref:DNA-(apurinic or apyrimidinic site) endonuclease n=1 Tax=Nasonia vitripennis TaxID=7425 RepID=A0A7M7IN71_NASVI|nr:exodeoxyribonuclease [Nasonia vitripennis]XP_016837222.1 exodeoxyribonuclease [Nasonia vitripennis]XP_032452867.1 exodeoxyribonuclease [Nasonia vitripennis]XP_032452868.1 exodeoxyribonuclease [Nasonia vitripennis]
MLRFINPKTVLLFHRGLNLVQRAKVLTKNRHQLQAVVTAHAFSKNFKDALNMPPKRGRPPKAKGETKTSKKPAEEKKTSKKTKRSEVENDENGADEPAPKKAKTESKSEPKKLMNKTESNLDEINFDCEKVNADGEKYNIKICTWNVSGIRAVLKKNGMTYLEREDADIIALQETKCETKKIPDEVKLKGYTRYFLDSKKAGYCGMALYSKKEPIDISMGLDEEFDDEGRLITAEYEHFYLVNVYVPNAGNKLVTLPKRLKWNEAFKKHIQDLDKKKPVIICGDMNVAHQEIDLKNPKTNTKNAGFTKEERDGMTDFLQAGFVDTFRLLYPDKTDAYTFWAYFNNARSKNIGWRLDYYIVSEKIKNKVCDVVNRDQVFGSDHCPVVFYANL